MTRCWTLVGVFLASCAGPEVRLDPSRQMWSDLRGHFSPEAGESVPRQGDLIKAYHEIPGYHPDGTLGGTLLNGPAHLRVAVDGPHKFISSQAKGGLLYLQDAPPGRRIVAAWVDSERGTSDAFLRLTPDELRNLWGLTLASWSDDFSKPLETVDPRTTHIGLTGRACSPSVLRKLPADLRSLSLDWSGHLELWDAITRFRNLQFLSVGFLKVDARLLLSMPGLRYLVLRYCEISNSEALGELKDLRKCDFTESKGVESLAFVAALPRLHTLDLTDTEVKVVPDLRGARSLRILSLEGTRIRAFPAASQLLHLNVSRTPLAGDADGLRALHALNPTCSVRACLLEMLRKSLTGVDRLEVFPHRLDVAGPKEAILRSTDSAEIGRLIDGIAIREDFKESNHFCGGGPAFHFMRGQDVAVKLTLDHGRILRWLEGEWDGDTPLTDASARYLCDWLAARGHAESKQELDR